MVAPAGLEPARSYEQQILSLQRLPFRHGATQFADKHTGQGDAIAIDGRIEVCRAAARSRAARCGGGAFRAFWGQDGYAQRGYHDP